MSRNRTLNLFVVLTLLVSTLLFAVPVGAAEPTVNWGDNFDSYATGSQLHGQGGWKGWFNDPLAGAFTSSVQAHSVPNSADILGASDLVHEYAGYTTGGWTYSAWQYVPTGYSGQTYFIMLNQYDDAGATNNWSVQVQFDSATNTVINEGASGGTLPLIIGQWVPIRLEIDLTANTQMFYYNNVLLYSGTWTEEVSGGGIANIGAVDLFANGATSVYYDDIILAANPPTAVSLTAIEARSADSSTAAVPFVAAIVVVSAGALLLRRRR